MIISYIPKIIVCVCGGGRLCAMPVDGTGEAWKPEALAFASCVQPSCPLHLYSSKTKHLLAPGAQEVGKRCRGGSAAGHQWVSKSGLAGACGLMVVGSQPVPSKTNFLALPLTDARRFEKTVAAQHKLECVRIKYWNKSAK